MHGLNLLLRALRARQWLYPMVYRVGQAVHKLPTVASWQVVASCAGLAPSKAPSLHGSALYRLARPPAEGYTANLLPRLAFGLEHGQRSLESGLYSWHASIQPVQANIKAVGGGTFGARLLASTEGRAGEAFGALRASLLHWNDTPSSLGCQLVSD